METDRIIIGSHNTMSYLPPRYWWMRPFRFLARCQDKDIQEQIERGARAIDLRIFFDRNGLVRFAHGAMTFKTSMALSSVLSSLPDGMIVRILLEKVKRDTDESSFCTMCRQIERAYPNIVFIGGYRKRPWRRLYIFASELESDMPLHQHVGSMAEDARWYEKIIPILYHKRKKLRFFKDGVNLYDFF